jgi:hypothetical protein
MVQILMLIQVILGVQFCLYIINKTGYISTRVTGNTILVDVIDKTDILYIRFEYMSI